jgi:hypothetical protein
LEVPTLDSTPTAPRNGLSWGFALSAASIFALALFALLIAVNVGAVAGGSDTSGYMHLARLLVNGHLHVPARTISGLSPSSAPPSLYTPLGFMPSFDGNGMVPTYPMGLPLLIALFLPIAGWNHAGDLTMILHSLAGLIVIYSLSRVFGLPRTWSILGTALVATSPLYIFMSLQAMSDVPSLVWTTAAILAALKCRERLPYALAAGGAMAVDVLLRPTNILALVPIGVALGVAPRRWILFILGGLPGAIFHAGHAIAAYGHLWDTGYGNNFKYFFAASYVPETLLHYAHWVPILLTPIAAMSLGLPFDKGIESRARWLIGSWIGVFVVFYSAYRCTHETWWYLRYLLPAVPAIVIASLLVCRSLTFRFAQRIGPRHFKFAVAIAIAFIAFNSYWWNRNLHDLDIGRGERKYGTVAEWMIKNLPSNSVCICTQMSGAIFYFTSFTFIRYESVNPANAQVIEAAIRTAKRPLYAVLFPYEMTDWNALEGVMPGKWRQIGNVDDVTIWEHVL